MDSNEGKNAAKAKQREALARAKEFAEKGENSAPGRVEGVPMDRSCKVGERTDFCYYHFDVAELTSGRARKLRDSLERRGYWPVDANSGAYVENCATAEIWATTWEASDIRFDAELQRHEKARKATRPKGVFTPQQQ